MQGPCAAGDGLFLWLEAAQTIKVHAESSQGSFREPGLPQRGTAPAPPGSPCPRAPRVCIRLPASVGSRWARPRAGKDLEELLRVQGGGGAVWVATSGTARLPSQRGGSLLRSLHGERPHRACNEFPPLPSSQAGREGSSLFLRRLPALIKRAFGGGFVANQVPAGQQRGGGRVLCCRLAPVVPFCCG